MISIYGFCSAVIYQWRRTGVAGKDANTIRCNLGIYFTLHGLNTMSFTNLKNKN